jgi:hypothetical protein
MELAPVWMVSSLYHWFILTFSLFQASRFDYKQDWDTAHHTRCVVWCGVVWCGVVWCGADLSLDLFLLM